ncbi:MAG: glucans biosynthesis glucosyltransferase MdoH [Acuticoccus sp.]
MDRLTFVPEPRPLAMPVQDVFAPPRPTARWQRRPSLRVAAARTLVFAITLAGCIYGGREMHAAASAGEMTILAWLLVAVFVATFGWISFSAANAITGLVLPFRPRPPARSAAIAPGGTGRTALVMPVYNEDARTTYAALAAMARDLPAELDGKVEIFILSDTTNPEIWVAEEGALACLRATAGDVPVWYRRRSNNRHRKAGNVGDFVRRWGGRYDHMVVLDADSLMTGTSIARLIEAIESDPSCGIVQTTPVLTGARTPFALAQQFANTIAGPTVAAGVASWQGEDGNYWGHNAIIRMNAFAEAAGLPQLSGTPPFGGTILSHDFVEAALIRRAGYSVVMRPDITGSYEGAPADLFGVIARDRRWAQGNLQHGRLLLAPALALASRVHFAIGILAYLMSPVWLLLILVGVMLSIQATLVDPAYFPDGFALFPTWPVFDTGRLVVLFVVALSVLLIPKFVALVSALCDLRLRRQCGGPLRLVASAGAELLVSTLVAPIMMMAQTAIVMSILLGRAVGWTPQTREGSAVPWRVALRFHASHIAAGIGLTMVAVLHSPTLAAWMSPTLIALILAAPISKYAGSPQLGRWLLDRGLMLTPQESAPPPLLCEAERLVEHFPAAPGNALIALVRDPDLLRSHCAALDIPPRGRGAVDAETALATVKLAEATSLEEYAKWLDTTERMRVLCDPALLGRLGALRSGEDAVPPKTASA